jgi:cation-transporting ATPase I
VLADGPQRGVDAGLTHDLVWRGAATAAGASLGWGLARATGSPERARTVGLASLVGTQLGQTVLAGGVNPPTLAAAGGSAALLALVVQTPGLSQLFGCRPIGPVGWATAGVSAAAATGALVVLPPVVDRWRGTRR